MVRNAQRNLALFVMKPSHQTFRHQRANLLARKVDDRYDQLTDKLLRLIKRRDLCARFFDTDLLLNGLHKTLS